MKSENLLNLIHQFCQDGSEATLKKGYKWFHNDLTPSIQQFSEKHKEESKLVGEAWLIAGEVHELILAPKQALTCYIIAKHFNPFSTDIYRWLALVQENLGQYMDAMKNIELALKYTNEGQTLMEDRQRIQDCIVYDKEPDFKEGNLLWQYNEALAAGNFDIIINENKKLQNMDIEVLKCLYRAYGGKQDKENGEKVWAQILLQNPSANIELIDKFYWS